MANGRGDIIDNMINKEVVAALMPAEELRTAYDQLKPFERQFVDAYIATDSPIGAVRAIFPGEGLDKDKARSLHRARAYDLIRRPLVQAAIAEKLQRIAAKFELTAERVLAELAKITYSNIDDYIDRSTGEIQFKFGEDQVSRDQMAAVGELTIETQTDKEGVTTTKTKFKLHDKLGAIEKALKHLGLYAPEKHVVVGSIQTIEGTARQLITIDMSEDEAAQRYSEYLSGGA